MSPLRVGVIFGGPSPEHDVSILTGLQVLRKLPQVPGVASVSALYWTKHGQWFLVPPNLEARDFLQGNPPKAQPLSLQVGADAGFALRKSGRFGGKEGPLGVEIALNCCHGGPGEDGTLQGVLDLVGLPYTGPTAAGALLGMDKLAFRALAGSAWLQMLPLMPLFRTSSPPNFDGPYILKPRFGGSSIGVEVVPDFDSAVARLSANPHVRRGAVLEPYQDGFFDLQVAVRTWPELQVSAVERPIRTTAQAEILDYSDKYVGGEGMTTAPRELPARIRPELEQSIKAVAGEVARLLDVRGVARIDFLSDGETAYVNEINTIPGSLARYLWIDPPLSFETLLSDMLTEATQRPSVVFSVAGSDGSVLKGAGAIGRKLG